MTWLRDLFCWMRAQPDASLDSPQSLEPPPSEVVVEGAPRFAVDEHCERRQGYMLMAWADVHHWLSKIELSKHQSAAWREAKRAWLLHMRCALGPSFKLRESKNVLLLSSLETKVASATLDYMERTLQRVTRMLDGVARMPVAEQEVMIIFDDEESYYRYVSCYYPEAGEYASSGGMHINAGCSHYATVKADLRLIEPVIAHEMTHGCLDHLPLPAWLNEGLAMNVEHQLFPTPQPHTSRQLHAKHLTFWRPQTIQEFWSGRSFLRPDEGSMVSYDLARLMVEQMSHPWEPFKQFVLAADGADAGFAAAREHLGVDLGEVVCALLEQTSPTALWTPDPGQWDGEPELGRFANKSGLV
jgi:hypothetical protein